METIHIDTTFAIGPVKPMNAVNNGPTVKKPSGGMPRGNFAEYRAARIPFARTHDSVGCVPGGNHACDITAVFPDFDADENDPKNYDFVFTDHYLDCIRRAGTQVFFRLGQTIESGPKKYGTSEDNNATATIPIALDIPGADLSRARCLLTDAVRTCTEVPLDFDAAGTAVIRMMPNSFAIVEWQI